MLFGISLKQGCILREQKVGGFLLVTFEMLLNIIRSNPGTALLLIIKLFVAHLNRWFIFLLNRFLLDSWLILCNLFIRFLCHKSFLLLNSLKLFGTELRSSHFLLLASFRLGHSLELIKVFYYLLLLLFHIILIELLHFLWSEFL